MRTDYNQTIIDTLSKLECALYYAADEAEAVNDFYPEYKELHQEAKTMLDRFHFLTGATIS
jgi:hypothetical protein